MVKLNFQKILLGNGVSLIVVPMDTKKAVISIFLKNGSQYERKHESGISHFVEHYLFRGTKKLSDFRAIEELLYSINADPHAHTDYEEVCYAVKTPIRHFETALGVISDILIVPTFKPDEVGIEVDIILQEMGSYLDKPAAHVQSDLWAEVCYGDQPAGRAVVGNEKTVKSFTAKMLEGWFKRHYVGEATKVVVAGGKGVEEFIPQLKEAFGYVPSGKARKSFSPKDEQKMPRCLVSCKETALTHLFLGVKTPFRSTDDGGYAAMILTGIINRNIYYSMIGDRGLSYERWAEYTEDPTKSHLAVYAGISHSRLEETVRLILAEYRRIRELGITNRELAIEIESIIEEMEESFEDEPMVVVNFFGRDELHRGDIHGLEEEIRKIASVTRNNIRETARKIFLPQNLNLAVLGPHKNSKELLNILRDF